MVEYRTNHKGYDAQCIGYGAEPYHFELKHSLIEEENAPQCQQYAKGDESEVYAPDGLYTGKGCHGYITICSRDAEYLCHYANNY